MKSFAVKIKKVKSIIFSTVFLCSSIHLVAQTLAPVPPMGWMSWNFFAENINENDIREIADAMVNTGMKDAGYRYIFIDDAWQGGRDNKNNIIADPRKFPSGIKALADYVHGKGLKLGIYSDAAQLTCGGYTASFEFEKQDAGTFASWGIDYLKYDYCGAPEDSTTAKLRYKTMADALRNSGREIVFGICEWGQRYPWLWASSAGGQLWRMSGDIRDKWKNISVNEVAVFQGGYGILDMIDDNAVLSNYARPGRWNDMDMLIAGLYGKKGPSGDLGGIGCTETQYQTQMSMWCMMASPLAASNDIRNMNEATKRILLNKDVIAIDQDVLGKQAELKIKSDSWYVFLKPLSNGDYALSILNKTGSPRNFKINFNDINLQGSYEIYDLWAHVKKGRGNKWQGNVLGHETKVFRLKRSGKN